MKKIIILIFLISSIVFAQEKGNIILKVSGFRKLEGKLMVALYNSKKGFMKDENKAVKLTEVDVKNEVVEVKFNDIDYGEYAISFYHDKNSNKKLDTTFIGIPKEGVGVSNNAKGKFGPPKYKDAKFELNKNEIIQELELMYLKKEKK